MQNSKRIITRSELDAAGVTYDTETPQPWFDDVLRVTGTSPYGHVVWRYGEGDGVLGLPCAVDEVGDVLLRAYEKARA